MPTSSGLDARAKPQRVRGKLVLGLGASPEDRVGAILTTAPTILKAGKIGDFPFYLCDVRHTRYKSCSEAYSFTLAYIFCWGVLLTPPADSTRGGAFFCDTPDCVADCPQAVDNFCLENSEGLTIDRAGLTLTPKP